ncbi:MAG TPA: amidase [Acidimicrobiales bacterium]
MTTSAVEIATHRSPDSTSTDPFVVGPVRLAGGSSTGALSGLTFAVKDLYDVAGTRTGAGNPDRLSEAPIAAEHAAPVQALLGAGAELIGKTVTDELAFSLSGTNIHYGTPRNPAAPGRVPGGSSSGSVSAVADGLVDFALGTDTGGSTRVPASYCGVFGLRATHGRISRRGVFLLAPSFCSIGVFSASAAVLQKTWRALESNGVDGDVDVPARRADRLVVVPELFELADPLAAEVLFDAAASFATRSGLALDMAPRGALGDPAELLSAFRAIQLFEAWELHGAWVIAHHHALGWGIASRFDSASQVDRATVTHARARRSSFQEDLARVLGADGYLLQPAASGPAPRIDLEGAAKDDLRLRTMQLTAPAGLGGSPVVSMPLATVGALPVGLALVGLPGDDHEVVRLANLGRA